MSKGVYNKTSRHGKDLCLAPNAHEVSGISRSWVLRGGLRNPDATVGHFKCIFLFFFSYLLNKKDAHLLPFYVHKGYGIVPINIVPYCATRAQVLRLFLCSLPRKRGQSRLTLILTYT